MEGGIFIFLRSTVDGVDNVFNDRSSSGCSILGIIKGIPPTLQLDACAVLLLLVTVVVDTADAATGLLPFLGTDITLVALSAFF